MKANQSVRSTKAGVRGDNIGVSAVIFQLGDLLEDRRGHPDGCYIWSWETEPEARTVAISATVYAYVSGMMPSMNSANVVPDLQFLKIGNSLVVSHWSGNDTWAHVNITGGTAPGHTYIRIGDVVTVTGSTVTIAYKSILIGTYTFP